MFVNVQMGKWLPLTFVPWHPHRLASKRFSFTRRWLRLGSPAVAATAALDSSDGVKDGVSFLPKASALGK